MLLAPQLLHILILDYYLSLFYNVKRKAETTTPYHRRVPFLHKRIPIIELFMHTMCVFCLVTLEEKTTPIQSKKGSKSQAKTRLYDR
jgi:hypothetical protein